MLLLLLQAMRGCVTRAGDKVSPTIRRTVTASLLQLLAAPEDVTRGCAAGCLAALLPSLPEEKLEPILADTQQTHGRSSNLAVMLAFSSATLALASMIDDRRLHDPRHRLLRHVLDVVRI